MDRKHFLKEMLRLENCFRMPNREFYGQERCQIIWKEVCHLSDEWMSRTVDLFIGMHRQPPLMPEFREEISRERERLWQTEKHFYEAQIDPDPRTDPVVIKAREEAMAKIRRIKPA